MVRKKNNSQKKHSNTRNKKAQGLSMNVIIIAALAIVVLAILLFLVYNKVTDFSTGLEDVNKNTCDAIETGFEYKTFIGSCPPGNDWSQEYGRSTGAINNVCCRKIAK